MYIHTYITYIHTYISTDIVNLQFTLLLLLVVLCVYIYKTSHFLLLLHEGYTFMKLACSFTGKYFPK